jgi:hypothetical protein
MRSLSEVDGYFRSLKNRDVFAEGYRDVFTTVLKYPSTSERRKINCRFAQSERPHIPEQNPKPPVTRFIL